MHGATIKIGHTLHHEGTVKYTKETKTKIRQIFKTIFYF